MRRMLLSALCVLLATLHGLHGQSCDVTVQLDGRDEIVLQENGTTCIQCFVQDQVATNAQWAIDSLNDIITDTAPVNGRHVESGQLVVSDARAFTGGPGMATDVICSALGTQENEDVYLEGFITPLISTPAGNTVNESGSIRLVCINPNIPGLSTLEWRDPQDNPLGSIVLITLSSINRTDAGMYECRLTNRVDNSTRSTFQNIIVQYIPGILSEEPPTQLAPLGGMVTLSCMYDSVPTSIVTWFQDGVALLDGIGNVNIVSSANSPQSELQLSSLTRDSGGNYSCTATNVVGSDTATVSVTIQVPPDQPTDVQVVDEQETNITISWTNNFNGHSPITGFRIVAIRVLNGIAQYDETVPGDAMVQSHTIIGLLPLDGYNITLSIRNTIGGSVAVPTSNTANTLSLFLEAPTIISFTNDSSTELTLDWEAPDLTSGFYDFPRTWIIEFLNGDGSVNLTQSVSDPTATTLTFTDLEKGTLYGAQVAGTNIRGTGTVSAPVTTQTTVDPPTIPLNVMATGVSAFGIEVSWSLPADNGGRAVLGYYIGFRLQGSSDPFLEVSPRSGPQNTSILVRNGGDPAPPLEFVNSTAYEIHVVAFNVAGRGDPANVAESTQSLDQPQRIFELPTSSERTNLTAVITWVHPGGVVRTFTLQYKLRLGNWNVAANVTIPGNETSVLLTDLIPDSQYDVRVRTNNALGESKFSFAATFITLASSPPIIAGPEMVNVGEKAVINCTDSVGRDVQWLERTPTIDSPLPQSARVEGNTLVFDSPQLSDGGTYICKVGSVFSEYILRVISPPTMPPPSGVSDTVIIAVCVVGGVSLLLFLGVVCLAVYCVCCSGKSKKTKKSSNYNVKTKSKGKRSMTWIETSTKFVPNTTPNYSRQPDEPAAFDLPDDHQTHSSFNTLEKQNRVRRSPSPREQDQPPPSYGSSGV